MQNPESPNNPPDPSKGTPPGTPPPSPPQTPYNAPPIANPTGDNLNVGGGLNNSGQPGAQLPAELQGVNVGAFFLNWIWAIAHNYWLGLLCLVPCVGIVMQFILLFKGNEFAWQNRRFDSIEQFKEIQRKWMLWGVGLTLLGCVFYGISVAIAIATGATAPTNNPTF